MVYYLGKTDIINIMTLIPHIDSQYHEEDAKRIKRILVQALKNEWIDGNDVYELIDVLPRIIPMQVEEELTVQEETSTDWSEYMDEHRALYKRQMETLCQTLINWVFMQNAVLRRNQDCCDEPCKVNNKKDNTYGIIK